MNKTVRLKQTDDQKVYFISDLHHLHNPVRWAVPLWKQRGYESVTEMNEDQITTINKIVRPNDILWHLGDITLNCSESQFEEFITRLQCQNIYCLWGNHNSPTWAIYQRQIQKIKETTKVHELTGSAEDIEIYPLRYRNLVFFGNYQELVVDGQCMVLEHYPVHVWNNMKDGVWHLCGHSHYNLPFSKADNLDAKLLDVGWDGQLKPYSMEDLRAIMDKKKVFDAGDHHAHGA
jgi:calcineurin-like phosphoesterase family protein